MVDSGVGRLGIKRRPHDLDSVGRRDVVVGLKIASGAREVVRVVDFAPRLALGEASAHGDQPVMRGQYPVVLLIDTSSLRITSITERGVDIGVRPCSSA